MIKFPSGMVGQNSICSIASKMVVSSAVETFFQVE